MLILRPELSSDEHDPAPVRPPWGPGPLPGRALRAARPRPPAAAGLPLERADGPPLRAHHPLAAPGAGAGAPDLPELLVAVRPDRPGVRPAGREAGGAELQRRVADLRRTGPGVRGAPGGRPERRPGVLQAAHLGALSRRGGGRRAVRRPAGEPDRGEPALLRVRGVRRGGAAGTAALAGAAAQAAGLRGAHADRRRHVPPGADPEAPVDLPPRGGRGAQDARLRRPFPARGAELAAGLRAPLAGAPPGPPGAGAGGRPRALRRPGPRVAGPPRAAGPAGHPPGGRGTWRHSMKTRCFVLGLDCLGPEVISPRSLEELPALRGLVEEGLSGPLESTLPPITVPAWSSMMTGRDPGELGVYGFKTRRSYDYGDLLFATSGMVRFPRVWDFVGQAGGQSIVIGVPQTSPPPAIQGVLISGFEAEGADLADGAAFARPPEIAAEIREVVGDYLFDVDD